MRSLIALFACLCALASAATAQDSNPQMDPDLGLMQMMLRFKPDEMRVADSVGRGETITALSVEHLRTGTLQSDLRLRGGLANYLNAGAPGFYAGRFSLENSPSPREMWCFAHGERTVRCLIEYSVNAGGEPSWAPVREPTNPYFPFSAGVSPNTSTMPAPQILEQPAAIRADLTANVIFRGWSRQSADIEIELGGKPILAQGVFRRVPLSADGAALIRVPGGLVELRRVEGDQRRAAVSFTPDSRGN